MKICQKLSNLMYFKNKKSAKFNPIREASKCFQQKSVNFIFNRTVGLIS